MNGSFGFAVSPGASGALTFPTTTFTGVPLVVISVSVAHSRRRVRYVRHGGSAPFFRGSSGFSR